MTKENFDINGIIEELKASQEDIDSGDNNKARMMLTKLTQVAESPYVPYSKIPDAVRNNILDVGKFLYQSDRDKMIATGDHLTGKTFTIEQFAYHAQRILHTAKMVPDDQEVAVFYADARRFQGEQEMVFINLVANTIEHFPGEVIIYTNNYYTAMIVEQRFPSVRMLVEMSPELLNEVKQNGVRLTGYSFAAGFSGDFGKKDTIDALRIYHKQQLVDHYGLEIPRNFINKFVSGIYRDAEIMRDDEDEESKGSVPMGYWVRLLNEALGEATFKPEKYYDDKGTLKQDDLISHILAENADFFNPSNALGDIMEAFAEALGGGEEGEPGKGGRKIIVSAPPGFGMPTPQTQQQADGGGEGGIEYSDMKTLADRIKSRVIGQDRVVDEVAKGFKVAAAGINDDDKPVRSMIFLGPTGVGKTQLAKTLSEELAVEPMNMLRLDMSEYSKEHDSAKLFGSPAGYVGHERGGVLTSQVAEHPNSVILLDEVEKAHPVIWDSFLQVFDAGRMTDSHGNTVDFTNTVIVMTSNLGANEKLQTEGGFTAGLTKLNADQERDRRSKNAIKNMEMFFKPELLNRIDDVFVFDVLPDEALANITMLEIEELVSRVARSTGSKSELKAPNADVINKIVAMSDSYRYGARDIKRVVKRKVSDLVAASMLDAPSKYVEFSLGLNDDGDIVVEKSSRKSAVKTTRKPESKKAADGSKEKEV